MFTNLLIIYLAKTQGQIEENYGHYDIKQATVHFHKPIKWHIKSFSTLKFYHILE